jgi:hypothetical protein
MLIDIDGSLLDVCDNVSDGTVGFQQSCSGHGTRGSG